MAEDRVAVVHAAKQIKMVHAVLHCVTSCDWHLDNTRFIVIIIIIIIIMC